MRRELPAAALCGITAGLGAVAWGAVSVGLVAIACAMVLALCSVRGRNV